MFAARRRRIGSAALEGHAYQFLPQRIQSFMKQPTHQDERNEDKEKPEKENPSRGIDPESKEPEKKLVNE
jgi:hypothetical protein